MSEHFINKCSCGKVISQCRCMGDKKVTVIKDGCDECKLKKTKASMTALAVEVKRNVL